jgi:hypothetical protein
MPGASGVSPQPTTQDADPFCKLSISIAICRLVIILALIIGVGLTSELVLRHVVQTFRCGSALRWGSAILGRQAGCLVGIGAFVAEEFHQR